MTVTSSTTSNPINVITQMDNINEYRQEISIAPLNAKRRKYIAKYNLIKTIENMDITLNEKIALSGMSKRKYEIERRIINKYPTIQDFTDVIDNDEKITFEEMTYKRPKCVKDTDVVYGKITRIFHQHDMPHNSPERNEVVTKLANNNTIELFVDDDNYFRYGDCLICGEPIHVGDGIIKHIKVEGTEIPYPCCRDCEDEIPTLESVLLSQYRYGNIMRKAYEEIISTIR